MKKILKLAVIGSIAFITLCDNGKSQEVSAQVPPMGWNSYDCYGMNVTEAEVKANADFMAQKLKTYGYEYIVVDFLWFGEDLTAENWQSKTSPQSIDEYGRAIPSLALHPSAGNGQGFKPLADYVHGLGLKFGIHIMRGIPWKAVKNNSPIKGTSFHISDIVSLYDTCAWHGGMRGINFEKQGSQEYVNSLFELYASWGVDFIKADDIAFPYHADDIEGLHKAIINCGRPMVLSLSPGAAPIGSAKHLGENADMWRISADFWDDWAMLKHQFDLARTWAPYAKPGSWPDADMLPVGKLAIRSELRRNKPRASNFTKDEQYSMLTLWCMMRSPLMIGSDLPSMDEFTTSLLTNKAVLDINQNSCNGREFYSNGDTIIWYADNKQDNSKYVAFFNHSSKIRKTISVKTSDLGLSSSYTVQNIWDPKNLIIDKDGRLSASVPTHGTVLIQIINK